MGSLNRDEWLKMWESIKTIESLALTLPSTQTAFKNRHHYSREILKEVRNIKRQIQEVIGQME